MKKILWCIVFAISLAHSAKIDKIHILCGTECDIKSDGTLDYSQKILKKFDFVYIGVHTNFSMDEKDMTKRILSGMENKYVDFLAHPTGRIIGRREPLKINIDQLLTKAKEQNIILEINAFPDRLDLNDRLIKQAKEYNIQFVIGTDSHNSAHFDFMRYGIATARRGWCEKKDVINTLSLTQLQKFLKGRR